MRIKSGVSFVLAILLVMVCFCSAITASAETLTFTYTVANGGVTVTGLKEAVTGELVIPDTIEEKPVVAIGEKAFFQKKMTSVVLPNSVTTIGGSAFRYCKSLKTITLSSGLLEISDYAFGNCEALVGVTIPETVTVIGQEAFEYCNNLKAANLPTALTELGLGVFAHCTALSGEFTIPLGITKIPQYLFRNTAITSVDFGSHVTAIDDQAFTKCDKLTSIVFPLSLINIGYEAFASCDKLTEITIGDQVEIGLLANPFSKSPIQTVHIAEGATQITAEMMSEFKNIQQITIPYGVTTIGERAFVGFGALTSIELPNSVTTIEKRAFYNCGELGSITIPDGVATIKSEILVGTRLYDTASNWDNGVLYVGNHLIEVSGKYKGELIVRDGTVTIAEKALSSRDLTIVRLPDSIQRIGDNAFTDSTYNLGAVVYNGNQDGWKNVTVGKDNKNLTDLVPIYTTGGSYGDVNLDNRIDAKDALEILKNAVDKVKFDLRQTIVSDVDEDGKINAKDALNVLKKAVGKIEWFPVELAAQTPAVTATNITAE